MHSAERPVLVKMVLYIDCCSFAMAGWLDTKPLEKQDLVPQNIKRKIRKLFKACLYFPFSFLHLSYCGILFKKGGGNDA